MSMREPEFQQKVALTALQRKFYKTAAHPVPPAAVNAELTAISTALASDPSLHDQTIETPPAALRIGPTRRASPTTSCTCQQGQGRQPDQGGDDLGHRRRGWRARAPRRDRRPPSDRREAERLSPHLHPRQLDRHADEQGYPWKRGVGRCRDQFADPTRPSRPMSAPASGASSPRPTPPARRPPHSATRSW